MSVHKEITTHVNKQNQRINTFLELDKKREEYISEAIDLCRQGNEFTTEKINKVTNQINELAKQGIVPSRKIVTPEMVHEYVLKLK